MASPQGRGGPLHGDLGKGLCLTTSVWGKGRRRWRGQGEIGRGEMGVERRREVLRGREGQEKMGREQQGGEEQKGSFKTAGASSLHSLLPLQQRHLQNTHWKAVTKFSHIGFVSVLKPKKKNLFCVFHSLCHCS